jgi:uncharacterized repeat protein (TIGR02543 family)
VFTPTDGDNYATATKSDMKVTVVPSNDATLSNLTVTGYSIVPSPFASNTFIYTLTVPNSVNSITIEATATDSKRQSITGTGAKFISVGENPFTITVTAEDNATTKGYLLIVTRSEADAPIVNAATPTITTQPTGGSAQQGTATTLTVAATKSDAGTLSYQWYSNTSASNSGGTALSGATNADYTTPTTLAEGTYYYYVVVTNTNGTVNGAQTATATSNAATVIVTAAGGATPATYTVTFNSRGGSNVSPQDVYDGSTLTPPSAPTREGYDFGGWYYEASCTNEWYFDGDVVTGNITLYAKWTTGTAIETVNTDKLQIYPNPTNGIVHISNADGAEIKVYSLNGELLLRTRESRVDLSGYPSGVYLLRIGDETLKVVKK